MSVYVSEVNDDIKRNKTRAKSNDLKTRSGHMKLRVLLQDVYAIKG
jgi:hypothetical protein